MTPADDRSPLTKRLAEIMPKRPESPNLHSRLFYPEMSPARIAADSFTGWLEGALPADEREMMLLLWSFGEILCGQTENLLNQWIKIATELQNTQTPAPLIFPGITLKRDGTKEGKR